MLETPDNPNAAAGEVVAPAATTSAGAAAEATTLPERPIKAGLARVALVSAIPVVVIGAFLGTFSTTDRVPAADGPHMLSQALRIARFLREGDGRFLWELFHLTAPHPPAGYLPMLPGAFVWGTARATVAVGDVILLLLLLDGFRRLTSPAPWWSWQIAWAIGCASAMTWWSADHYGFDLVTAAAVVQVLSWLQASGWLKDGLARTLFVFWLAAAFLTKYSAPMVLFLPVIVVAGGAMIRRPGRVLMAGLLFLLTVWPYYSENADNVLRYVHSALNPPQMPGNFPEQRTLIQRFGGEGQAMFLAVIKDALGWPAVVLLLIGVARTPRWIPLLGVVSGVVFLGAMNSREGRYALPMVFLLCAAGAPAVRSTWRGLLAYLAVLVPPFLLSAVAFLGTPEEDAPFTRNFDFRGEDLLRWGTWPKPAEQFRPISNHPDDWLVAEVLDAAVKASDPDQPIALVLGQDNATAPGSSVYVMISEEQDLGYDYLTVHLGRRPNGLIILTSSLAPFPIERANWPHPPIAYVVHPAYQADITYNWLRGSGHSVLQEWALPNGRIGKLVHLDKMSREF